jgi:hypothetical protein
MHEAHRCHGLASSLTSFHYRDTPDERSQTKLRNKIFVVGCRSKHLVFSRDDAWATWTMTHHHYRRKATHEGRRLEVLMVWTLASIEFMLILLWKIIFIINIIYLNIYIYIYRERGIIVSRDICHVMNSSE